MAQGDWTKEEVENAEKAAQEIMEGMPKRRSIEYIGHFNDIFILLATAKEHAPDGKGGE
jgi:hypothetical protein